MSRFFLLLFIISTGFASTLRADENVYLIENIAVDAKGKTPDNARIVGLVGGRREAFTTLVTKLGLDQSLSKKTSDDDISDMIKSEQINDEKLAGNRYLATLTVEFAPSFVDKFLKGQSAQEAPAKAESILIIPGRKEGNHLILWAEDDAWKKSLETNFSETSKNFMILPSDAENVALINQNNIDKINAESLKTLMNKYNSKIAFIAIFNYDSIENRAFIEVDEIRDSQKSHSRLNFVNVNNLAMNDLISKVAQKTLDHFLKLQNSSYSKVSNVINIEIISDRLSNWVAIKNKIEDSNLTNQLNIESISQDRIKISINYIRPEINIIEAFSKIGIPMKQTGNNSYLIFLK